jgi:hypothetical protein
MAFREGFETSGFLAKWTSSLRNQEVDCLLASSHMVFSLES